MGSLPGGGKCHKCHTESLSFLGSWHGTCLLHGNCEVGEWSRGCGSRAQLSLRKPYISVTQGLLHIRFQATLQIRILMWSLRNGISDLFRGGSETHIFFFEREKKMWSFRLWSSLCNVAESSTRLVHDQRVTSLQQRLPSLPTFLTPI